MNWVGNDKRRLNSSSSCDWCIAGFRNPSVPSFPNSKKFTYISISYPLRGSSFAYLFIPISSHSQSKHFLRHFGATPTKALQM